jgi:predicted outer membrane protein
VFTSMLRASALAVGIALIALPASAMDETMSSTAQCTPDAMHSSMMSMSTKMSSMKSTGDVDKDYAATMMIMAKSMRDMSAWVMKCGKNAKTKKMATESQKSFDALYHQFDGLYTSGT